MPYHEYFPEEFIQLNKEILHHPVLQRRLANHPIHEFEIRMAEVAAYCLIAVDGEFYLEDLIKLAALCLERLQKMPGVNPADQQIQIPEALDWTKKFIFPPTAS